MSDNMAAPERNDVMTIYKVRLINDIIISQFFDDVYHSEKKLCIEGGIVLWKGRLKFRQYILKNQNNL